MCKVAWSSWRTGSRRLVAADMTCRGGKEVVRLLSRCDGTGGCGPSEAEDGNVEKIRCSQFGEFLEGQKEQTQVVVRGEDRENGFIR